MKDTRIIMGMPITVDIQDVLPRQAGLLEEVFAYFTGVDEAFSPYRPDSQVSRLNRGQLRQQDYSKELIEVLALAEQTRQETDGYFDIRRPGGLLDPSGLVKGWAIRSAANLLAAAGSQDFFVEAGGDVQASRPPGAAPWTVGIRNPFAGAEIIKVLKITSQGVATSGTYERGQHIYNPHRPGQALDEIASLTVVGPDVYEADRFATAAFAMGRQGIEFIARRGLEGYQVDRQGKAAFTPGLEKYL
ncbi:MAG TPA: FAD:protein FMN transferase [Patescibacteria group bacterium]|nr:FAD:protein FMN transferase [Patescibacteria group bacterium]